MKCPPVPSAALLVMLAGAGHSMAALSYFDPFTDGQVVGGADNSGINWYDRSTNSSIATFGDSGAGTLNSTVLRMQTSAANRGFVGVLTGGAITLSAPGDYITLSFSFRVGGTMANTSQGFTFGLYSSNGTVVNAVDTAQSDDDLGYRGQFGTGTTSAIAIVKEANTTGAPGGLGTGTVGVGNESAPVGMSSSTPVNITNNDPHTGSITLTFNSPTDLGIVLTYDGNTVAQGSSTVPYLNFDEVVFSQAGNNNLLVDNISVVSNVPEPSSMAALLLTALAGCTVRRRARA